MTAVRAKQLTALYCRNIYSCRKRGMSKSRTLHSRLIRNKTARPHLTYLDRVYLLSTVPRPAAATAPDGVRASGGTTTDSRRHEAFESGNPRDAYSSVHHLKGNLDSISFAIGLREDEGQEGALERLLPMLKIQPRPLGEVGLWVRNEAG